MGGCARSPRRTPGGGRGRGSAHLAALHGRPAGAFGAVAAFSFYPTKNMTTGEGAWLSVPTRRSPTGEAAAQTRVWNGVRQRARRFNMRMSELHAAIGRVQLRRLPGWTERRRRNAARLTAGLTACPAGHLGCPRWPRRGAGLAPVHGAFGQRDELMAGWPSWACAPGCTTHADPSAARVRGEPGQPAATEDQRGGGRGAVAAGAPDAHPAAARARVRAVKEPWRWGSPVTTLLSAGVVGLGRMGRHHVRVLGQIADVELVGWWILGRGAGPSAASRCCPRCSSR